MWRKACVMGLARPLAACMFAGNRCFSGGAPPSRAHVALDQVNGNMLIIQTRADSPAYLRSC